MYDQLIIARLGSSVTESVVLPLIQQRSITCLNLTRPLNHRYLRSNGLVAPSVKGRMMLARIEPGPNGSDLRTFECPKCEHVQKMLVEDPLKSANTGWTAGGLKPPK